MFKQQMWKWHRLIGYVIGLQVLLWILGGVVMSWFDIETVRGEHNIKTQVSRTIPSAEILFPLENILTGDEVGVRITHLMDTPIYELSFDGRSPAIFNAISGEQISPLNAKWAMDIAVADFSGKANPEVRLLEQGNGEYRGALPVWQVQMNDGEDTNIYVSPNTGRVVARRNNVWRIFDFFWMLHIMDYENRTDFNNLLLQIAAAVGLLFSLTGIALIYFRVSRNVRKIKS